MYTKNKAKSKVISYIILLIATPAVAVLLTLALLAILNVTNLTVILIAVSFAVLFSSIVIAVLQDKYKITEVSNFKRFRNIIFVIIFYYVLLTGISILVSRAIFLITVHGIIYNGDLFAESLTGGVVAILAFNAILFRKIFNKSIKKCLK